MCRGGVKRCRNRDIRSDKLTFNAFLITSAISFQIFHEADFPGREDNRFDRLYAIACIEYIFFYITFNYYLIKLKWIFSLMKMLSEIIIYCILYIIVSFQASVYLMLIFHEIHGRIDVYSHLKMKMK